MPGHQVSGYADSSLSCCAAGTSAPTGMQCALRKAWLGASASPLVQRSAACLRGDCTLSVQHQAAAASRSALRRVGALASALAALARQQKEMLTWHMVLAACNVLSSTGTTRLSVLPVLQLLRLRLLLSCRRAAVPSTPQESEGLHRRPAASRLAAPYS